MKKILFAMLAIFGFVGFSFAAQYTLFYGDGCSHCANVEKFFEQKDLYSKYDIELKEVWNNSINRSEFVYAYESFDLEKAGVPFLLIEDDGLREYKIGDSPIIRYFNDLMDQESFIENINIEEDTSTGSGGQEVVEEDSSFSSGGPEVNSGGQFLFFYADACPHCQAVEQFIAENDLEEIFDIEFFEVRQNRENLDKMKEYLEKLNLGEDALSVPFLIIDDERSCNFVHGSTNIINFFEASLGLLESEGDNLVCSPEKEVCEQLTCEEHSLVSDLVGEEESLGKRLSFFGIMLPAALADSINPCAFAVMMLLLTTILSKEKSRKKAVLAGLAFAGAVFVSYLAMGFGLFSALASAQNTTVLKIIVGSLGILVGLANLKDFFRYGRGFIMEVPLAWRPKMKKIIEKAVSPGGAFVIGLIVSLFLLPCTSGPYFTVLGYLASEEANLHSWGIIYLLVYNIIFVLPMLLIAAIVGFGWKSVDDLARLKDKNKKNIHLVVGLLMLGLGIYVFGDVFLWWV